MFPHPGTHWCWPSGTVHRGCPRPGPGSNSRTRGWRQPRSRQCTKCHRPLGHACPGNSSRPGCLDRREGEVSKWYGQLSCRESPSRSRGLLTHTAHPAGVQLKILGAAADVAAGGIDTQAIDAVHGVCALVDICGVGGPSVGSPPLTPSLPPSSRKLKPSMSDVGLWGEAMASPGKKARGDSSL